MINTSFRDQLYVEYIDGEWWRLSEPFRFYVDDEYINACAKACDDNYIKYDIIIPRGFYTDFATIPNVLCSFINPKDKYNQAAVLHDYLYVYQDELNIPRKVADFTFLYAMNILGINKYKAKLFYYTVRVFGGIYCSQHCKKRKKNKQKNG